MAEFLAETGALGSLAGEVSVAWAVGATPEQADDLLALVLERVRIGTPSSLRDDEDFAEPISEVGDLSVVLDGAGDPERSSR